MQWDQNNMMKEEEGRMGNGREGRGIVGFCVACL